MLGALITPRTAEQLLFGFSQGRRRNYAMDGTGCDGTGIEEVEESNTRRNVRPAFGIYAYARTAYEVRRFPLLLDGIPAAHQHLDQSRSFPENSPLHIYLSGL